MNTPTPYTEALRAAMALVEKAGTQRDWRVRLEGCYVWINDGQWDIHQDPNIDRARAIVACFNLVRTYGEAVLGEGWRTMESAPRDGTRVLAKVDVFSSSTHRLIDTDIHVIWYDEGAIHADAYQGWDWDDYELWHALPALPTPPEAP